MKQASCEERIDAEMESTISTLRDLWEFCREGNYEEHHPEHETGMDVYHLSFDYIPVGTFNHQDEGYFRYQISWGGPSDEFRFYVSYDKQPCRIQYHFMDWFDGARRVLGGTDRELLEEIFQWFEETGAVQAEFDKAAE